MHGILDGAMPTVVALHAHPDDESSKGAGTVARLADDGNRCVLVCATGGEAGDILNPAMDRPAVRARLADHRSKELAAAAEIIGYDEIVRLGYRDSGMPGSADNEHPLAFVNAQREEVLLRLVEILRREQPDVVFGYDAHERYPHPDHLRIHEMSKEIVRISADRSWHPETGPPWEIPLLLAPTFTARRAAALLAAHEASDRDGIDPGLRDRLAARQLDEDDPRALVSVDVTGYVARSRRALLAHETQIAPDAHWFSPSVDVVESAYPYEDFEVMFARDGALERQSLFAPWEP